MLLGKGDWEAYVYCCSPMTLSFGLMKASGLLVHSKRFCMYDVQKDIWSDTELSNDRILRGVR